MISIQFVYIMRFCKEVKTNNEQGKCWPGMELLNLWLVGSTLGLLVMNLYRNKTQVQYLTKERVQKTVAQIFYMLLLPRLSCQLFLWATFKISFCLILMLRTRHSINGLQRNVDFHHDPWPEFSENSHGSNCLYQHRCLQVDSLIQNFFDPPAYGSGCSQDWKWLGLVSNAHLENLHTIHHGATSIKGSWHRPGRDRNAMWTAWPTDIFISRKACRTMALYNCMVTLL